MRNGHFDYGNGFHGRVYLNAHQLFRHPSTIWRLAQDLLEVLPGDLLEQTEVVAGPVMGGALLAHTLAGLLDGRRVAHAPAVQLRAVQQPRRQRLHAARLLRARDGRQARADRRRRAEYREDVPALRRARARRRAARVLATVEICDRMEAVVDAGVPNYALAEYKAPENFAGRGLPDVQGRRADHAVSSHGNAGNPRNPRNRG